MRFIFTLHVHCLLVCNDKDNEFREVLTSPQREIPGSDFRAVRLGFVVE